MVVQFTVGAPKECTRLQKVSRTVNSVVLVFIQNVNTVNSLSVLMPVLVESLTLFCIVCPESLSVPTLQYGSTNVFFVI